MVEFDNSSNEKSWDVDVDIANERSWYFNRDEARPFIAMSVGTAGPSRQTHIARKALAGNMSKSFGDPNDSVDSWLEVANKNTINFCEVMNISPENVKVLTPQRDYSQPLNLVEVDNSDVIKNGVDKLVSQSDFIYTYNPETVLAVMPADCPIIVTKGQTERGPVLCYTHIAWRGGNAGYIDQMFDRFNKLGIDFNSLRMYVSCGARAENYPYNSEQDPRINNPGRELLFKDVTKDNDNKYSFYIDTPVFIRDQLKKHGISDYQIFQDTSDTARQDSGYFSHGRAMRHSENMEINGRDMLIASLKNYSNYKN